jgi:hypothetical protein
MGVVSLLRRFATEGLDEVKMQNMKITLNLGIIEYAIHLMQGTYHG